MSRPLSLPAMLAVLDTQRSITELQSYFGLAGRLPRTGSQFERLGGGGARTDIRNAIAAEDLIAIELLSVRVLPQTALDLLQGQLGRDLSDHLAEIPSNVDLSQKEALRLVDDDSPAANAWRLLKSADGIGWVIAGKLLARKRPRLIPVYDEVVSCAYGTGKGFWRWLHGRLGEEGCVLADRLAELRNQAGVPKDISAIRILDVVIWMRHRDEHKGYRCRGLQPVIDR